MVTIDLGQKTTATAAAVRGGRQQTLVNAKVATVAFVSGRRIRRSGRCPAGRASVPV